MRRIAAQEDEPLTDLLDRLDVADLRALTVGIEALTQVAEASATDTPTDTSTGTSTAPEG